MFFGQTPLWDEPVKAVLVRALAELNLHVPVLAGVHDTDYFSKLPGWRGEGSSGYTMVPRNDGFSRELWAAIGEISALFGSETPVTLRELRSYGVPVDRLVRSAPEGKEAFVNRITEAWGWRGLVRTKEGEAVGRDVLVDELAPALRQAVAWAVEESIRLLATPQDREHAQAFLNSLLQLVDDLAARCAGQSLTEMFKGLLKEMFRLRLGQLPPFLRFGSTSEFFLFNRRTAQRERFLLVDLFLDPATSAKCKAAYDAAVRHTGMYELAAFGEGALPFDLVVPGRARGTLRITETEVVADLPQGPTFLCWASEACDRGALGAAVERRFGPGCSLVGKAAVLPVMLLSEGIMVLNEGGSPYIATSTREFVRGLVGDGVALRLYPILRLRYPTLDSFGATASAVFLPPHLARAFGEKQLAAEELARRWREVLDAQRAALEESRNRPGTPAIMRYLCQIEPEFWERLCEAREQLLRQIRAEAQQLIQLNEKLAQLSAQWRAAGVRLEQLQRKSGEIRRAVVKPLWEKLAALSGDDPQRAALAEQLARAERERKTLQQEIAALLKQRARLTAEWRRARETIARENREGQIMRLRRRLAQIETEAEIARLQLVSDALRTLALEKINHRPTSWWFSLFSRGEQWFSAVAAGTEAYFEELAANITPHHWS